MKPLVIALMLALAAQAQQQQPRPQSVEQQELTAALAQAGDSQLELIRALERHLQKYPSSAQKVDIERAIVKTALEIDDKRRILAYGEQVLAADADNAELLERLTRLLLDDEANEAQNRRAMQHAKELERWAEAKNKAETSAHNVARRYEEFHMITGKALVYQARAAGNLGNKDEALALAQSSFESSPSAESAREIARWLERSGKLDQTIAPLADAFLLEAPQSAGRTSARKKLGEVAAKLKLDDAAIGLAILHAQDRLEAAVAERRASLRAIEPNFEATEPLDYVVSGLNGDKLALRSLAGKVIVMDFWATWCIPCRTQQPLYDVVKARFKDNPKVVFLNVASDEDHAVVKPFLDDNRWDKTVYYDDGLAVFLRVASIPTTVIFSPNGEIHTRMVGFIPELFVEMLTERIREALEER